MDRISKKNAVAYLGGFGDPSAMPCPSFGISRDYCPRGKVLRTQKGAICASCYARKGNYCRPQVRDAQQRRVERLFFSSKFVDMFEMALERERFFRFFDSGDIPNLWCLERIMAVVARCPWCRFWIPTREYATVTKYLAVHGGFPKNVNVRVSADYLDRLPDPGHVPTGCTFSTVVTLKNPSGLSGAHLCMPTFEDRVCEKCEEAGCRACWDRNVQHVCYKRH